jgi:hypothetical protein
VIQSLCGERWHDKCYKLLMYEEPCRANIPWVPFWDCCCEWGSCSWVVSHTL